MEGGFIEAKPRLFGNPLLYAYRMFQKYPFWWRESGEDVEKNEAITKHCIPLWHCCGGGSDLLALRTDTDPCQVVYLDHEMSHRYMPDGIIERGFYNFLDKWFKLQLVELTMYCGVVVKGEGRIDLECTKVKEWEEYMKLLSSKHASSSDVVYPIVPPEEKIVKAGINAEKGLHVFDHIYHEHVPDWNPDDPKDFEFWMSVNVGDGVKSCFYEVHVCTPVSIETINDRKGCFSIEAWTGPDLLVDEMNRFIDSVLASAGSRDPFRALGEHWVWEYEDTETDEIS